MMRHMTWPSIDRQRQDMASRFQASRVNSRRRRLRILNSVLDSISTDSRSPSDPPEEPVTTRRPVILSFSPSEEATTLDRSFSMEKADEPRTIPVLLSSQCPVSWLFVGDSFTPKNVTEPRPWRVYTNRFAAAVRTHFQRPKDVFIDATFPAARLSEVLFDFEKRIAKFEPDICFLSLCLAEADAKSVERFERMLVRLIRWSRKFDCELVLQTPPCLQSRNDSELTRRLILIESIRGIAAEHAVPLVDHWEHWEGAASQDGHAELWIDAESHTPDEQGHLQLAKRLIHDLKLNDIAKPEISMSIEESVLGED